MTTNSNKKQIQANTLQLNRVKPNQSHMKGDKEVFESYNIGFNQQLFGI